MDTTIIAAAISGIIALMGIIASVTVSRYQLRNEHAIQTKELEIQTKAIESQLDKQSQEFKLRTQELEIRTKETESQAEQQRKEFELRTQELRIIADQLRAEYESFRQAQYLEILRKRIEIYPDIWSILVNYMINWKIAGKPQNYEWACQLLDEINDFNARGGAFFSEDFYRTFAEFRYKLIELKQRDDQHVLPADLEELNEMYFGSQITSGLSVILKDDLGSYGNAAIQARVFEDN